MAERRRGCTGLIVSWLVNAAAVGLTAWLLPGVHVAGIEGALLAALVLGLLNTFVRPVLVFLTLPATVLTLGLFLLVINAAVFLLADWLLDGFAVDSFWWALGGSVVLSVLASLLDAVVGGRRATDD